MKIYIHIGFGKTGTTSIQDSLYRNNELLSSQGFLYPKTGLRGTGHHNLCKYSPHEGGEFNALVKEIEAQNSSTVIISSESLHSKKQKSSKA